MSETKPSGTPGRGGPDVPAPYAQAAAAVVGALGSDTVRGLTSPEAANRLATYGPNTIKGETPPSIAAVALQQLRDPMNLMLVAVSIVSFLIGEVSTGIIVALLILLNVVLGSRQELKARASVDALSNLQVPQAKVVRGGQLVLVPASDVVPGDVVQVEAGDLVPADGRILRSATLEAQEAALTGRERAGAEGRRGAARRRRGPGRPHEHAVPEHLGDPRHRVDGGHRHGHEHPDGSDRHDADLGDAEPFAAPARTRLPDQGDRHHRVDSGRLHRGRRPGPRHAGQRAPAAGHGDGDLGDPDRPAGVRLRPAVAWARSSWPRRRPW